MSPPPDDAEDRAAILARRAAFVAAALAALGASACDAPPNHAPIALDPVDAAPSPPEVVVREGGLADPAPPSERGSSSMDSDGGIAGTSDAPHDAGHGKDPRRVNKKPMVPSSEPRPCLSVSGSRLLVDPFDDGT